MSTPPTITRNVGSDTPEMSLWCDIVYLDDASSHTYTVPSNVGWVMITPNGDCWYRYGAAAAKPAADVTDGSGSHFLASGSSLQVRVAQGGSIGFIRDGSSTISVSISGWKLQ